MFKNIWWQKCIFSLLPSVIWNEWLSQTIISIFIVPIFWECVYAYNLLSRYIVERKCQRHKLNHCHPLKWVRAEYIQQNFSNNLIQRIHVIKNTFWKMADVIKFCFLLCIHLLLSSAFELIWTTFMLFFTILLFIPLIALLKSVS